MKFYLFILLLALIFCNDIEKKEKINLLGSEDDFINSFFADIINIINNCSLEHDCVFSQIEELIYLLTDDNYEIIYEYFNDNDNCKNDCASHLSSVGASTVINEICDYLCE